MALFVSLACASASALGAPESPHLAQHRKLTGDFTAMLVASPAGAMKFAQAAVESTKLLGPYDPKRGDALEMLCRAYMSTQDWTRAMPLAAQVVVIRRAERPPEPELLSLALLNHAVVLFGAERQDEADAALTEVVEVWRQAFGEKDLRRAEKLEQFANTVQGGFGRNAWVAELLGEALKIRELHPPDAHLAITLYDLAVHEMLLQDPGAADGHLARAVPLFEAQIRKQQNNEDMRARLVQVLVARAGIAASLGNQAQAVKLIEAARAQRFKDRVVRAEMGILVATGRSEVMRRNGDLDAAIDAQLDAVDVLNHSEDLIASGALDVLAAYDALVDLGRLFLAKPDLALARQSFDLARKRAGGESPELLFLLAELEEASGHGADAMKQYQAALVMLRETAGEASVLYGTNRLPRDPGPGRFGGDTGTNLAFGRAEVLVPGAKYSDKSWLTAKRQEAKSFGRATDPEQLLIRKRIPLDAAEFAVAASAMMRAAKRYDGSVLVFVHGFNVSFDQALQRAAQLRRDLNYDSALFVFSWPSKGSMLRYGTDRRSADAAVTSLVEFLAAVEKATGAQKIHLIAHSMGNRVLLPALVRIAEQPSSTLKSHIGEVILAAPAVPQTDFIRWIDRIAAGGIDHFTLYASGSDKAMLAGLYEEGTVLAGFAPHGVMLRHPRVQSIDLTLAGLPGIVALNHDVFASNPVMADDMRQLLQQSPRRTPGERLALLKCREGKSGEVRYWVYDPAVTASSSCGP